MQIAILYSIYSANGKGKKIVQRLSQELSKKVIRHQLYENIWPNSFSDYDFICLVGGDGTFNYFVNKYPKIITPVFLLPGGTGNDFYWNIYRERKLSEQIQSITQCALGKRSIQLKHVDIAYCRINSSKIYYYLNSVGLGFDGEVLKKMNTIRWIGGHIGYLLTVIKVILKFKEPEYEMHCNGTSIQGKYTIINIANSPRTGGGFLISPDANSFDSKLNLLYCYLPKTISRLLLLAAVEKGKHIQNKKVVYKPIERILIKTERSVFSQLDGELIEGKEYEIGLSDWKFNLIA